MTTRHVCHKLRNMRLLDDRIFPAERLLKIGRNVMYNQRCRNSSLESASALWQSKCNEFYLKLISNLEILYNSSHLIGIQQAKCHFLRR